MKHVSLADFDPNKLTADQPLWGIYDGVHFKTFAKRGHAINSFMRDTSGKLFSFENGRWVEQAYMSGGNKGQCDVCGKLTDFKTDAVRSYYGSESNYGWSLNWMFRRRGGKILTPLELVFVCRLCVPLVRN